MHEPIWNQFLTDQDKQVFAAGGFGALQGFGKRPALLVVDVSYDFCGDRPEPILESIKRWRASSGAEAWKSIAAIKRLLVAGRSKGLPVIYTTNVRRPDMWDSGSWAWKSTRTRERSVARDTGLPGHEIIPDIAPQARDIVIHKHKPSAFFETPLVSFLTLLGADSIIVTGGTTSGCVRASVVDAFSYNYRVAVVEEGCFDRSQASHALSLCDMHAKYADVIKLDKAMTFIDTLAKGMFKLPAPERPVVPMPTNA
jgi:maleamate amidohydrolase